MGPTEVSYYLGSRGDGGPLSGVNDMYLDIGFSAPPSLMTSERLTSIWLELIQRHALLAATVEYNSLEDMRFCYDPLSSDSQRRQRAAALLDLRTDISGDEVVNSYLNGPRYLSDDKLSSLIISTDESSFAATSPTHDEAGEEIKQSYHFMLVTTHFLGDGMALHLTANEFFLLLAGKTPTIAVDAPVPSETSIERVLRGEEGKGVEMEKMALAMESKLPTNEKWGRLAWAGAKVEFNLDQAKLVGGHIFPRAALGTRLTLVPTISYLPTPTSLILRNCKSNGVTIAHAVFALANISFIKAFGERDERVPMMLYSAMNLRPWLINGGEEDWFCIAIGYYNIILPAFVPSTQTLSKTFWSRALSTRIQTSKVVKSPWLLPRAKIMALERERRSIGFEREDERRRVERGRKRAEREMGKQMEGLGFGNVEGMEEDKEVPGDIVLVVEEVKEADKKEEVKVVEFVVPVQKKAPSLALMGVSMLGNLDGMYKRAQYHGITLTSLKTGSRQRPGALLLFAYTFLGKLWFSLGFDVHGFEEGAVEAWWAEMQKGVEEFLLA